MFLERVMHHGKPVFLMLPPAVPHASGDWDPRDLPWGSMGCGAPGFRGKNLWTNGNGKRFQQIGDITNLKNIRRWTGFTKRKESWGFLRSLTSRSMAPRKQNTQLVPRHVIRRAYAWHASPDCGLLAHRAPTCSVWCVARAVPFFREDSHGR